MGSFSASVSNKFIHSVKYIIYIYTNFHIRQMFRPNNDARTGKRGEVILYVDLEMCGDELRASSGVWVKLQGCRICKDELLVSIYSMCIHMCVVARLIYEG